ncbi:MAG: hypothetical protein K2X87_24565 [Gemmataceae bacterium]|nr:hypothetical protein [Gemmataceae bacterium]
MTRRPQLVILDPDGPLAALLAEPAGVHRWLVRRPRAADAALGYTRDARPTVLLVRIDPAADDAVTAGLIADVHRMLPDVAVVAVSDAKLADADRAAWTAVLMDLGCRYVLFPPVAPPALAELVTGLMTATVRRVTGKDPDPADGLIDLADEELHG